MPAFSTASPLLALSLHSWPSVLALLVACAAVAWAFVNRRAAKDERINREVVSVLREMSAGLDGRQAVCEAAQRITGCSRALLFEPGGSTGLPTEPTASAGSVGSPSAGEADRVLYREVVEAWLDGRARVVADALGGTLLLEPVIRDGEAAAVLCLRYGAGTTPPSRRQSAAVRLLAVEAAVAIERAEHAAQVRMSDRFEVARRLARDLHDSVSQDVALSSLYAHTAMKALDGGDTEEARKILDEAANQLTRAQDDLRAVMRSLRQGHRLDGAATLPELIDALAAEHERRAGAPVLVARDASEWVRIAPEVADAIYFAVREALHNALKHAKGAGVRIELHADDDEVRAAVRDDGPGFDPSHTPHGCWGLIGMRERAERLGGHVDVSSRPGYGTTVAVTLPRAGASMPVSG